MADKSANRRAAGKIWGRAARTGSATWCWSDPQGPEDPPDRDPARRLRRDPRAGSVRDGTTVTDFEESEHAHGRTNSLAVAPLVHADTRST